MLFYEESYNLHQHQHLHLQIYVTASNFFVNGMKFNYDLEDRYGPPFNWPTALEIEMRFESNGTRNNSVSYTTISSTIRALCDTTSTSAVLRCYI